MVSTFLASLIPELFAGLVENSTQQKMICYMRCVNAFFIDITNIFVNMTDFSCHLNQKDTLRIPYECLCIILTYYFLLCKCEWIIIVKHPNRSINEITNYTLGCSSLPNVHILLMVEDVLSDSGKYFTANGMKLS